MTRLGFHCNSAESFEAALTTTALSRAEFYNLPQESLPSLKKRKEEHKLAASVHAPLAEVSWYPKPPTLSFLCDLDEDKRNLSFRLVEETLRQVAEFEAEYVVVHFPVPSTTKNGASADDRHEEIAWDSAARLAKLSEESGIPIHIEGFGPTPVLDAGFLMEVHRSFPSLYLCFDTGHMHIAGLRDGFDLYEFADQVAPAIGSLHLWNNRGMDDYLNYGHVPIHPEQRPEDGWVDLERILNVVMAKNDSCKVILESSMRYPKLLEWHDFRDGVRWIRDILAESS